MMQIAAAARAPSTAADLDPTLRAALPPLVIGETAAMVAGDTPDVKREHECRGACSSS